MNVQYLSPFLASSLTVLEAVLGQAPTRGEVTLQSATFPTQACNVICRVMGQAHGQVIYGMSGATAYDIASAMLGAPAGALDALAVSALTELGSMISGGAMHHLSEAGLACGITPPSLLRGDDVSRCITGIPAIVVPLATAHGALSITIGLQASAQGH